VSGLIEFANGATATLTLAWGTAHRSEVPVFNVYGTDGVLAFPNPNSFGDAAYVQAYGEQDWTELPGSRQPESWPRNLRGLGVAEMILASLRGFLIDWLTSGNTTGVEAGFEALARALDREEAAGA